MSISEDLMIEVVQLSLKYTKQLEKTGVDLDTAHCDILKGMFMGVAAFDVQMCKTLVNSEFKRSANLKDFRNALSHLMEHMVDAHVEVLAKEALRTDNKEGANVVQG